MQNYEMVGLFPTPLGRFCLNREFTKEEMEFVNNLERRQNAGNFTSINEKILQENPLKDINEFCLQSAVTFFNDTYKPNNDLSIYITQSWCNYTDKNQFHHDHNHSNSVISGVLYFNADVFKDRIQFYKPVVHNNFIMKFSSTEFNFYNSESWWVPAGTGMLYLFPSQLKHGVPVTGENYEQTRISLSFNTFLSGRLGEKMDLTELILK